MKQTSFSKTKHNKKIISLNFLFLAYGCKNCILLMREQLIELSQIIVDLRTCL